MKRTIHIGRVALGNSALSVFAFAISTVLGCFFLAGSALAQQRSLGLDVAAWQGNISQTTWNNIYNVENREFVFIRSSRGGTTGFYNQSDPNNNNGLNTFSQRYDDPYFVQNITRATNAGLLAGPYHFSRADIVASTQNSGGIANTGADEADHFIEMAGAWMRPGYLLPVFDLEKGINERSSSDLAQFSVDFSNRINSVMGIRPTMYLNGSYSSFLQGASSSLRSQLVSTFPALWNARYAYQGNPDSPDVQTAHPKDTFSGFYGPWDDPPNPTHPWSFWQYASVGRLQSYNNGNSNLDFNVAQGGIEFLKDHLVPALWTTDSNGQWSTLSNWNSGQAPIAPVQGPGQVPRAGALTLPTVRLPSANDTVILDRSGASITVTLASGSHTIRKLEVREQLDITGGSLTVNYVPSADSTPLSAQFSAPVSLNGGALSVHTLQVDAAQTFSLDGGTLTFDTIHLMPDASTPAQMAFSGDMQFDPLDDTTASILNGSGGGSSGLIDLGGANRVWQVSDGLASVDLSVEVPIVNGGLTKSGAGTLALNGANAYSGDTIVLEGTLSVSNSFLSDTADLYLSLGATLDIGPSDSEMVDSFFLDGVSQPAGVWGAIGSGTPFTSSQITGSGVLIVSTFINPFLADFDNDGDVDGNDLTDPTDGWETRFGVDLVGSNFLDWQREYGQGGSPLSAGVAVVPEPSSLLILISLMSTLVMCRHRV